MTKLIFGCGYLGERVARLWREAGAEVAVVTRRAERAAALERLGFRPIVADVTRPESLTSLPNAETLLFAVGHNRAAQESIADVYAGGVRNALNALPRTVQRFVYISTTGVYGPAGGEWVDENTLPDPQREGGKASLAAEIVLASHSVGANSVILRLAGIYGPGRVPFLDELRTGRPIPAPIDGYLNLIHVDDAAAIVFAAGRMPAFGNGPRTYCVSDGQPVTRSEFYCQVARQIGAQPPSFVEPKPNSPRAERAAANRRISNNRMQRELQVSLKYANYRAGLAAILETKNQ
jgi:nucleoside-diphosphate-sugar epimerase